VYLSRFAANPIYAGVLEGSAETASPHILAGLPERAAWMLSPAKLLVVVPPSRMPLPKWLCVAELGSPLGARQTDPDYSSWLYVCWFTEDTARSIDAMVEAVLPHLDWERSAEDYDSMAF
jgi:hypothetical protein